MTLKGGTAQACAACKFQRRKCTSECLLAPYFPADQPKTFLNVHKLFGVSNIVKLLKMVEPHQKKIAMESVIIQANFRERYPVLGTLHEISRLQQEIAIVEEELLLVYQHLELYRQQQQQQLCPSSLPDDATSQLELGMASRSNNALPLFNHSPQLQTNYNTVAAALSVSQQHSYANSNSLDYNNSSLYLDSKENVTDTLWLQSSYPNDSSNSIAMQHHQLVASQSVSIQQGDYDEIHPFFNAIDDRQSYIYSKEAYETSSEESLKDTRKCTEHVSENELKSAAACFSLTSVN